MESIRYKIDVFSGGAHKLQGVEFTTSYFQTTWAKHTLKVQNICLLILLLLNYLDEWITAHDSYNKVPALIFLRGI